MNLRFPISLRASVALLSLMLITATQTVRAQDRYPSKPVRLLVGSLAGGATDVVARRLAAQLAPVLGQSIVVENKAGAGGMIAGTEVARAKADGYTLQMGSTSTNTLAPLLQSAPSFQLLTDFEVVSVIGFVPLTLFVPSALPVTTIAEMMALARQSPGKLSYASAGVGTTSHLTGELFKLLGGELDILHVPYRGGPAMDQAVSAGEVQLSFDAAGSIAALHRGNRVRAVAVLADRRADLLPEVPTVVEQGYPELISGVSFYVLAPARTPAQVLEELNQAISKVIAQPEFRKEMARSGVQTQAATSSAEARAYVRKEVESWSRVIQSRKIKLD